MSGLSLWLSPPASSKLSGFIKQQAAKLAASPSFNSHATLVSDEIVPALDVKELQEKIEAGVAEWRKGHKGPLELTFKDVRQGELC